MKAQEQIIGLFLRSACRKGISFCQNERERSCNRAQAARALPFPLDRKRKQKGPFCTARRQRGAWGTLPHACFSCFVLFASSKENEVAPAIPAAQFMIREEEIGTRSGRAGPSFSVRPEKEAKGAVSHGTSAAEKSRHVKTRSANLPKLNASRRFKHMGRFVFTPAVRGRGKNPLTSHADHCCGRCLGLQGAFHAAISKQRNLFKWNRYFLTVACCTVDQYDHKTLLTPCFSSA